MLFYLPATHYSMTHGFFHSTKREKLTKKMPFSPYSTGFPGFILDIDRFVFFVCHMKQMHYILIDVRFYRRIYR